jgi:hypothetical protein
MEHFIKKKLELIVLQVVGFKKIKLKAELYKIREF